MKKLVVNEDVCIGCGACVAIDSEHFDFNDEGISSIISNDNIDTDAVKNAISSCPVNAIKLEEVNSEEKCECTHEGKCECGDDCKCHHEDIPEE